MHRSLLRDALLGVVAVALLAPSVASAKPLTLPEVYALNTHVTCRENVTPLPANPSYDDYVRYQTDLAACGEPARTWEKDGIPPVNRTDHELALLEYQDVQDPNRELVCYRDADRTIVIPGALCPGQLCQSTQTCSAAECAASATQNLTCVDNPPLGPRCTWPASKRPARCTQAVCDANPTRSFSECADGDGDMTPKWLEDHLGTSDGTHDKPCGYGTPCGFEQTCDYIAKLGAGQCRDRPCKANNSCTAFHLEMVAQDDQEVLVHIHYDWSPVPARVLSLHLTYDKTALALEDARPLTPLSVHGKAVAQQHLSDGTLRVTVYDTGDSAPIPTGPIVELVFRRTAPGTTKIAFSKNDKLQAASIAPLQGDKTIQEQLHKDTMWGASVDLPARKDVKPKLRLWYGYGHLDHFESYSNVPTAAELCAQWPVCANEKVAEEKEKLLARLDAVQRGSLAASELIKGPTGDAAYLDGGSDHQRLPIHFDTPLNPGDQSVSGSMWFYSEGTSPDEKDTAPQILYTHNNFSERTNFGLLLRPVGKTAMKLVFFSGDLLSKQPKPTEIEIEAAVPLRTWHHVAFTLDAHTGAVELCCVRAERGQTLLLFTFAK